MPVVAVLGGPASPLLRTASAVLSVTAFVALGVVPTRCR
jgi:hypothetical protein